MGLDFRNPPNKDAKIAGLPDYDTSQVFLPHSDHAFYPNPIQVMGFYGLEGESENAWESVPAVLATLENGSPELYGHLCKAPTTFGRASRIYGDPMYQVTAGTALTTHPGSTEQVKSVR